MVVVVLVVMHWYSIQKIKIEGKIQKTLQKQTKTTTSCSTAGEPFEKECDVCGGVEVRVNREHEEEVHVSAFLC